MLKSQALHILSEKISCCTKCEELTNLRKENNYKTVPGNGNPNARLLFVGEAPGENEADQGIPFCGRAGNLFNNILKAADLTRDDVFVCNILCCRPPGNRVPLPEEANNCRKFLDLQIKCVDPEWIVCLGQTASVHLLNLNLDTTIGSLRNKIHTYENRKVICTYHPSFALRSGNFGKKAIWDDLKPVLLALQNPRTVV